MDVSTQDLEDWIDRHAIDSAGQRIGTIADVYVDDATGEPEWLAVTTGLFGSRISFVPLGEARRVGDDVRVAYGKDVVKDSPNVDADGALTEDEEERLYRHYGLKYKDSVPAASTILDTEQAGQQAELQMTGSSSVSAEITPEIARLRLRKRDADAVKAIQLDGADAYGDSSSETS